MASSRVLCSPSRVTSRPRARSLPRRRACFCFSKVSCAGGIPPRSARELAHTTARLCRLLRDEVTEQLGLKSQALTDLAVDWRKLLFPNATDQRFADGYAQAVTFGMLMARAKGIALNDGLDKAAAELSRSSTLIGAALRLLTDNAENQETLKTSLGTLTRVLHEVDWKKVSKGESEAWLYFYEEFLDVYDKKLRKETGSYYEPPEVVGGSPWSTRCCEASASVCTQDWRHHK